MKRLIIPKDYKSELGLLDTEIAIKFVKDTFERLLADKLNLTRVSAPLFVFPKTGLNDNLNGYERRVNFDIKNIESEVEIVQSLAKWKRHALARYQFIPHTGLYTDMNAIRRDEDLDTLHSAYVDQWDWEKIIDREDRNEVYLRKTVKDIYSVILELEHKVSMVHPHLYNELPHVDLVIRTSGELRISNFMLYQASYAEYYFPETLFPDFNEKEFDKAILEFNKRNRRFGGQ